MIFIDRILGFHYTGICYLVVLLWGNSVAVAYTHHIYYRHDGTTFHHFPNIPKKNYLLKTSRLFYTRTKMNDHADDYDNTQIQSNICPPPNPYRQTNRVAWAGTQYPNQSSSSSTAKLDCIAKTNHDALNPPRSIPDPYGWMRDESRTNETILHHIHDENIYFQNMTSHLTKLNKKLQQEMMNHMQETDYTAPMIILDRNNIDIDAITTTSHTRENTRTKWVYYTRTFEKQSYPVYCRAPAPKYITAYYSTNNDLKDNHKNVFPKNKLDITWDGDPTKPVLPGEIQYLNVNQLTSSSSSDTKSSNYCAVGQVKPSPSQNYVAYSIDTIGNEKCQLYIRNLNTLQTVELFQRQRQRQQPSISLEINGVIVWGNDDSSLFYIKLNDQHRPYQVYYKKLSLPIKSNNENKNHQEHNDITIDNDNNEEILLFEEGDDRFNLHIYKSHDGKFLFIQSASTETSEIMYIDLDTTTGNTTHCHDTTTTTTITKEMVIHTIAKRRPKVLYYVEHYKQYWLITTNFNPSMDDDDDDDDDDDKQQQPMPNMRLMISPDIPNCEDQWDDLRYIPKQTNNNNPVFQALFDGGKGDKALHKVLPFQNHLVCEGRQGGLPQIWIVSFDNTENSNNNTLTSCSVSAVHKLKFLESPYNVMLAMQNNYYTNVVNVLYTSLVTPMKTIGIHLNNPTNDRIELKCRVVPKYNPTHYKCHRMHVLSRDGKTKIPVSMVYRYDLVHLDHDSKPCINHTTTTNTRTNAIPTHLVGYGAYGSTMEANFDPNRLLFLDRGFVYVIAHVRGGGEMGREWYEEPNGGKLLCKKNSFDDFVDVARWIVEKEDEGGMGGEGGGFSCCNMLSCEGRSAGGLLIGASINQAPELFRVAILGVPFVDVACTMVDETLPLTIQEWEEWGNPNDKRFFDYIMSYSPIQNVKTNITYPSCLLTGGLHDPRVQYWEPLKFAAELRYQTQTRKKMNVTRPICVKIDLMSGHYAGSDRYKFLKETSSEYAFLFDQLGLIY